MTILEIICALIVGSFWLLRMARDSDPRRFVLRMAILTLGSWVCENTVISAYGFYHYNPGWHAFIGHVPLAIVLIWPMVVHSAWDLARALARRRAQVPALAALFVLADASLIEPVAVHARLWYWTEPGLFAVPPIGILGWALFALAAVTAFERRVELSLVFWAAAFVHAALLGAWWLLFRWINTTLPAPLMVTCAWAASLATTLYVFRHNLRARVSPLDMIVRVPAAGFFFVLLAVTPASRWLWLYACAFVPPYLALLDMRRLRVRAPIGE